MNLDLILTPGGRLHLREGDKDRRATLDAWMKRVAAAFSSSQASGLFTLAVTRPDTPPPPSFSFWRDFASRYLTQLCRTPESTRRRIDPIEPPFESELATMLLSAPSMQGGEYLCDDVFRSLWIDLDAWARKEIASSEGGLAYVKGQWIEVDRKKLSEALEHWKQLEANSTMSQCSMKFSAFMVCAINGGLSLFMPFFHQSYDIFNRFVSTRQKTGKQILYIGTG